MTSTTWRLATLLAGSGLVFACGSGTDGSPKAQCLDGGNCCVSNDDCARGEFCNGGGPCDSEGTCEAITRIPCGLMVDPDTGMPAEPVCGCDGTTYQGTCMANNAGERVAHAGSCEQPGFEGCGDLANRCGMAASCATWECSFEPSIIDCPVACANQLAACAEGCGAGAICTRSLSMEGCLQACDAAPGESCGNATFGCYTLNDSCYAISRCLVCEP